MPGVPRRFSTLRTPAPEIPPPPALPTGTEPPPSSGKRMSRTAQIIGAAAALIVSLGGVEFAKLLLTPKPATAEQNTAIIARLEAVERSNARIEQKLDAATERQATRDEILSGWACRMNGDRPTPIARGAPCNELRWEAPPLGSAAPWIAREEWPP